jgi:hypothetical protein
MVRAPEYEEMDRARSDAVPRAFAEVFGERSGYRLKEERPNNRGPIAAGPIERSTYHVYKGLKRVATIYQNGYIEVLDDDIRERLLKVSEILEAAARQAYDEVMRHDI